jgi:hypothetical protein
MSGGGLVDDPLSEDDVSPVPAEARARVMGRVCAYLAAMRGPGDAPTVMGPQRRNGAAEPPESMAVLTQSGVTLRSPSSHAWGVEEASRPAPVAANDVRSKAAPGVPAAPPVLLHTGDIPPELRAKPPLPFRPMLEGQPQPRRAPKTAQSRVYGLEPGKTAPLGDTSIARAVAGVLPFAAPPLPLTLRQYASLCAELSFWPSRAAEILQRYQVPGEAARAALDAFWSRERAARPELRAAFDEDVARYTAWLRAQGA